jgi:hypothetical protein
MNSVTPSATDSIEPTSFDKDYETDMNLQYNGASNQDSFAEFGFSNPTNDGSNKADAETMEFTNDAAPDNAVYNSENTTTDTDGIIQSVGKVFEDFFEAIETSGGAMFREFETYQMGATRIAHDLHAIQASEHAELSSLDQVGYEIDGLTAQFGGHAQNMEGNVCGGAHN